jgi:DNA-binding MurR/RpiR family transcriptional regulator
MNFASRSRWHGAREVVSAPGRGWGRSHKGVLMRPADPISASAIGVRTLSNGHTGDLAATRRVLEYASAAIEALGESLNGDFSRAVETILAVKGRVIVSGMGKSGHIARKIAATLASTGTPAHFVHPAEASHGDLGAVTRADALLMLSYSGETHELSDLITFAKRFSIPLIGIASNPNPRCCRQRTFRFSFPGRARLARWGWHPRHPPR